MTDIIKNEIKVRYKSLNKFAEIAGRRLLTTGPILACCLLMICLLPAIPAHAGSWVRLEDQTWVYNERNTRLTGWQWIDGNSDGTAECYYFDPQGVLVTNTMVEGWTVNADGAWVQGGAVQTQAVAPGSHYPAGTSGGSGSDNAGGTVIYTPALARVQSVPHDVYGNQEPYLGKVWTYDDYVITKSEARATGKLLYTQRCTVTGCCNPRLDGGLFCGVHTCKESGCMNSVALSAYNAGFCYTHMKAHGIDEVEFAKQENAERAAARAAAEAEAAAKVQAAVKAKSKTKSSRSSSTGQNSTSTGRSYSSGHSSNSGYSSSGSGSSSWGSSGMDAYDEGYEDVYENDDYDIDRYNSDWDYMLGVDDAMEELGEDW